MKVCWLSVLGLVMVVPAIGCGGSLTKSDGTGGVQGGSGVGGAGQGTATGGATGSAGVPGGSFDASSGFGGSGGRVDGGGALARMVLSQPRTAG